MLVVILVMKAVEVHIAQQVQCYLFIHGMLAMKVLVSEMGIKYRPWLFSRCFKWNEIDEIGAARIGHITFDEDYLILQKGADHVAVGETNDSFNALEAAIFSRFPDFPKNWRDKLGEAGFDSPVSLFRIQRVPYTPA
ncbi:MAG: hypothetical protein FJX59_21150 [Alphaproteobacteria bacterium]|nr:hypothetical protein [Alphaproteobacteria bacterium]